MAGRQALQITRNAIWRRRRRRNGLQALVMLSIHSQIGDVGDDNQGVAGRCGLMMASVVPAVRVASMMPAAMMATMATATTMVAMVTTTTAVVTTAVVTTAVVTTASRAGTATTRTA